MLLNFLEKERPFMVIQFPQKCVNNLVTTIHISNTLYKLTYLPWNKKGVCSPENKDKMEISSKNNF